MAKIVKLAKTRIKQSQLLDVDMLLVSNYITNEAVRKYLLEYHKRKVPFRFIEFFHSELETFPKTKKDPILKEFFERSEKSDLDVLGFVYFLTFPDIVKTVVDNKFGEFFFVLNSKKTPPSMKYRYLNNEKLEKTINLLGEIVSDLNREDELVSIRDLFDEWKIQNPSFLRQTNIEPAVTTTVVRIPEDAMQETPKSVEEKPTDVSLLGKKIDIPKEVGHEKVYHLFIPTLPLPSDYPTGTKSRVHSAYHADKFLTPSRTIEVITGAKIVSVKYTKSFFDLRSEISKASTSSEKKWSDFF